MKRDSLLSVVTEPCLFSQIPPSNQLQGSEAGKKPVAFFRSTDRCTIRGTLQRRRAPRHAVGTARHVRARAGRLELARRRPPVNLLVLDSHGRLEKGASEFVRDGHVGRCAS